MIYNGKLYKRGKWINEQYIPDNEFDISRNQSETPSQNRVFSSYPSFEEDGQKKIVCKNGSVYIGKLFQGRPHGFGTMHYFNGSQYEGEWVNGKPHLKGTYTSNKYCRIQIYRRI